MAFGWGTSTFSSFFLPRFVGFGSDFLSEVIAFYYKLVVGRFESFSDFRAIDWEPQLDFWGEGYWV